MTRDNKRRYSRLDLLTCAQEVMVVVRLKNPQIGPRAERFGLHRCAQVGESQTVRIQESPATEVTSSNPDINFVFAQLGFRR